MSGLYRNIYILEDLQVNCNESSSIGDRLIIFSQHILGLIKLRSTETILFPVRGNCNWVMSSRQLSHVTCLLLTITLITPARSQASILDWKRCDRSTWINEVKWNEVRRNYSLEWGEGVNFNRLFKLFTLFIYLFINQPIAHMLKNTIVTIKLKFMQVGGLQVWSIPLLIAIHYSH